MKPKKRIIVFAVLFTLSVANFIITRGGENVKTIQFLSIFTMGMLFGLLFKEIIERVRNKPQ